MGISAARIPDGDGHSPRSRAGRRPPLYTAEQRRLRDRSPWTRIQAVLAPFQFLVFLLSLAAVLHALRTDRGMALADASVVLKTLVLYLIMITGAFWEKAVFGRFLFAPAFFHEDAVGMVVIALHTAALASLLVPVLSPHARLLLALAAYASYLVNASQFVLKLRLARVERRPALGAAAA